MSNQQADITYVICQTTSGVPEVSVWWQVSRPLTNTGEVVVTASAEGFFGRLSTAVSRA